jgi:hypothetical protein
VPVSIPTCATASSARTYARREPETSALHLVVREHLQTFLATVREKRGKDLPRYAEDELRRYLRCGVLAHGFVRVACRVCGEEVLVAYSCKCRGACPSCCARRMCGTAAHLVAHVLPDVPVRQWVLTAPDDVRRVLALRPVALTACARVFVEEISRFQKHTHGLPSAATGAVTFVQRFNATLGTFVHFHVIAPDGVFVRDAEGAVMFHEGRAPSREEIATVAARVEKRMARWLRRRGLIDDRPKDERSNEAPELSPIEACMQLSLFGGALLRLDDGSRPLPLDDDERFRTRAKSPWTAEAEGYNVHAGVTVRAGDREGLERLLRYCARPPVVLERISRLADGRVAYRLRKPRRSGATHLVLDPIHFLARVAAQVPPPRFPLTRFAGVFAPHSTWRAAVVPRGPVPSRATLPKSVQKTIPKPNNSDAASPVFQRDTGLTSAEPEHPNPVATPNVLGTSLGASVVKPVGARIDWASLLKRTFLEDILACPCGGRRRILADIQERNVVVAILSHLGLPFDPPPIARARSPAFEAA